jgi:hypothetical protein
MVFVKIPCPVLPPQTKKQNKRLLLVILSGVKNLFFRPPRFFTPLCSVQNDMNIQWVSTGIRIIIPCKKVSGGTGFQPVRHPNVTVGAGFKPAPTSPVRT